MNIMNIYPIILFDIQIDRQIDRYRYRLGIKRIQKFVKESLCFL